MRYDIVIDTLRSRQNGHLLADNIFKCIFLNENVWISIKIAFKFVPKGLIYKMPALVQIMAWHRTGDKPLSEPCNVGLCYQHVYASLSLNELTAICTYDFRALLRVSDLGTCGSPGHHKRNTWFSLERRLWRRRKQCQCCAKVCGLVLCCSCCSSWHLAKTWKHLIDWIQHSRCRCTGECLVLLSWRKYLCHFIRVMSQEC